MKRTLLKRKIQTCYFRGGLLILAACVLLISTELVRAADTRIAFMSTRNSDNSEIFLMNPDRKRVRQLTRHLQYDSTPAWSPDGQKIAFMSFRDEHRFQGRMITGEIYVMNADGTDPINLTQSPERWDRTPSWSPDGKQIVYSSTGFLKGTDVVHSDIWVMEADRGNLRNLTNDGAIDSSPDWSPDGLRIAFSTNRDGDFVMNADGTNPVNLTNHPARDGGADWSPDGLRIAFSSNRNGDWEKKPNDNWEVYAMNADGTNPINLTNQPKWDSGPSWAPVPTLSVSSKGKLATLWGHVKHGKTYGVR